MRQVLIPFRLNNSAYDVFAISFTYSVGGASCPADCVRRQGFLFRSTQVSLPDSRNQCTNILEKWYYQDKPQDVMMLVNGSRSIEDYINTLLEVH